MDRVETTKLVALIEAMCPAQRIADDTPKIWSALFEDIALTDALVAVKALGMRQEFIAPKDVIAEVARVRKARTAGIDEHLYRIDEQFPSTPEGVRDANAAKRVAIKRIADGESHDDVFGAPRPVEARRMPNVASAFRSIRDVPDAP